MNLRRHLKYLALFATLQPVFSPLAAETTPVRTVSPRQANGSNQYEVPGRTEPVESATIYSRATGTIRERKFNIGEVVKAGDVLAVVEAPEIDREVEAARANVEQAIARATNAKNLADRSSRLRNSDVVSAEESDQREMAARESAAAVRVAQAELARLEELQKFSVVRAPFEGIVAARNFDRGDHVHGDSGDADGWLYELVRIDTLRFVVHATPDLAMSLQPNSPAEIEFAEFPGRKFSAHVAHSSRSFDTTSGTMQVELFLENPDLAIPAGLTGSASFQLAPQENAFLVPANALVMRAGNSCLATVEDGLVRYIEVKPIRNLGADVEIISSGITKTSDIILNPNAMLSEGAPVAATPLTASK